MNDALRLGDVRLQDLATRSLQLWLPSARFLYAPMAPGRSGAELVQIDISGETGDLKPGTYVLRVGPTEENLAAPNEIAAHGDIRQKNPEFAQRHIPELLRIHEDRSDGDRLVASLHSLAGGSIARYAAPRNNSTGLLSVMQRLSHDLLEAWADPHEVVSISPRQVLLDIAGKARSEACLAVIADFFDREDVRQEDGHAFLSPRAVLDEPDMLPIMKGLCHGDLHTGNVLVPRDEIEGTDENFWIVDVNQARRSVVGFDLAYLEVSILVNQPKLRPPILSRCLEAAENLSVKAIPDGYQWLVDVLQQSRAGIQQWIANQPGRLDALYRQLMLARIVAALLWARRFPGTEQARTCLAYAGWYAMRYRRSYAATAETTISTMADVDLEETREELWQSLWSTVSGFAPNAARYILLAEQLPREASVAVLGRLPWSVIIDLDPNSDGDGLRHLAGPVLDAQRAVHVLTADRPVVDYARGTAWLLAAGSMLRHEPALELREWVIRRLDSIRRLTTAFRQAIGDTPVFVIVLEGGADATTGVGRDRLLRVIETMDEMLQGRAVFLHVGLARLEPAIPMTAVPLPVHDLLDRLTETLGSSAEYLDYRLPAADNGVVPISPESMQKLREHMVILHEGIETVSGSPDRQNDIFWRGGLIGWADLDANMDVLRTVNGPLVTALRESLEQHRTRTVVLEHRPGSGGTTAALRAAWDLHEEYPVAVLLNGVPVDVARVPLIADRLHRLYIITQMPVLLVAEASDLSESYRELLYRELAARNARVTMLYVRRTVGKVGGNALQLSEPLDEKETDAFFGQYAALIQEEDRTHELRLLGSTQYAHYRTPFFYGLITFEREFTKLSTYVRTHLDHVRGRARDVMQYLALATIFSNTGLQMELVQKLMHVSNPSAELSLADVLGPEAARLVTVRSGRLRLQHQLLAEQVLSELLNDERWDHHLRDLSIDFIQALALSTDMMSEPLRLLLRQMFVDRQGWTTDGAEDRRKFAPLIERLDLNSAHQVLKSLTEHVPEEPHFWNHLGRHQMYRLNRELDKAEEYVTKAVDLAPNDFLHYHTLGLARRSRMRQFLRNAKPRGVHSVMKVADRWFGQTVECFATARKLNPEGIYGYITHVQAIVDVAKALKGAGGVNSVADLGADAGEWIAEHISVANELLDTASQLYSTLDHRDDYLLRCQADITRLYGDLDSVVELWELAVAGTRATPMVQRALAQAYYVRGGRSWRELQQSELHRIVDLARQNLSRAGAKEEDFRLWFEAYKMLPQFDLDEALSQLQLWSARFPSWRAHYYRYCLFFLLWFNGGSDDIEAFQWEQQEAKKYIIGRSNRSYLWFSNGPDWCPLIADSDLGEWNRKKNFWTNTSMLQRVNGVIDHMRGPQAGTIQLYGNVTAFFVPAIGGFLPESDENSPVNFLLGFSPEGLRAWDVRPGHVGSATHARDVALQQRQQRLPERKAIIPEPSKVAAQAVHLSQQRKLDFCIGLLEAWATFGDEPRLSRIVDRVRARFREDGTDVLDMLTESPRVHVGDGEDPVVRIDDGSDALATGRQAGKFPPDSEAVVGRISFVNEVEEHGIIELVQGGWARFTFGDIQSPGVGGPTRGQLLRIGVIDIDRRGGQNARDVELLPLTATLVGGEIVPSDALRPRIESDLRTMLEERFADGTNQLRAREVEEWLENRFSGGSPLAARLGLKRLDQLWPTLPWLERGSLAEDSMIRLRSDKIFGRVALPEATGAPKKRLSPGDGNEFEKVLDTVLKNFYSAHGRWPTYTKLRILLSRQLGERYHQVVSPGLQKRLEQSSNWSLHTTASGLMIVLPAVPEASAKPPIPNRAFGQLLAEIVPDLQSRGRQPTLQAVGDLLRKHTGLAYNAMVGKSLKVRIEREPGWQLKEVRPNLFVIHPVASSTVDETPKNMEIEQPDVARDLLGAVRELWDLGGDAKLTQLGALLRERWGADRYKALVSASSLRGLVHEHGLEPVETAPGVWVLRRKAAEQ